MAKRRKHKLLSELIPDSWLDPLLTGSNAVLKGNGPWGCPDIERLLLAVKDRVMRAESKTHDIGEKK